MHNLTICECSGMNIFGKQNSYLTDETFEWKNWPIIAKPPGNGAISRTAFKLIKNSKTCIKRVLKKYTLFQLFQIQCQLESSIDHYTENVGVFVFSSSVFKMSKSLSQHLHFLGKLWA